MPGLIGLDFETYGAVSLPRHGLARYLADETFRPLIASVAWADGYQVSRVTFDFVDGWDKARRDLIAAIGHDTVVAHNAPFEQWVLYHLGIELPSSRFCDSAVVARAAGAGGRLEAAAPQLLGVDKMVEGKDLMRLFSMPGKYQERNGTPGFDGAVVDDHPVEWADAELGLRIVQRYLQRLTPQEMEYQAITMDMNFTGWPVDLASVEEMHRRYLENQQMALAHFRATCGAADLNLNSLKQLKEWCADRGIKATSFDEKHVASLLKRLHNKLITLDMKDPKWANYVQVQELLRTKQILGGSSLKKLQVILDTVVQDKQNPYGFRLADQYLHCGAGQSLRTTGRSVQMQNLKRLSTVADMAELEDEVSVWDNGRLAENLRQVFTSSDLFGRLIVGDFASVESRGLAWQAGEEWKLQAYRKGEDIYKTLATKFFGVEYERITPEQRQAGKVGELACGYGAAGEAVRAFAANMGVELSEGEATKIVVDWRAANPATLNYWYRLDDMLKSVVQHDRVEYFYLPDDMVLRFNRVRTPDSLLQQDRKVCSIQMSVLDSKSKPVMRRYFLGCHQVGRNIRYYRPSDRKTGDLWKAGYVDPKTKQYRFYELYGGKIAGILTQSLCREIFFGVLKNVHQWVSTLGGQVAVVGQFHDEIVLDWKSGALSLEGATAELRRLMSDSGMFASFPLAAAVKSDYRYIK
jgi:DNA polymerase